jgi:hypothetical protein
MWALSEMLDNAREAIFILVGAHPKLGGTYLREYSFRTGGLPQNYIFAALPRFTLNGGLTEC